MSKEENGIFNQHGRVLEFCLLVLVAVSTISIFSWVLGYSNSGFDFTDEGYYAVWIRNPFLYDWSTTQFGFVYHPLYLLIGENLALLRKASITLTFLLATALFYLVIRNSDKKKRAPNWPALIVSASLATASLVYLNLWIATPSYNTLALQALLITAIGFSLSESLVVRVSALGWSLIGIGGWLAFMAKPTTAVLLVFFLALYLLLAGKLKFRAICISAATAGILLLLSAMILDGSPTAFLKRLQLAAEFSSLSGAGYSLQELLRIDVFEFNERDGDFFVAMTGLAFIAAGLVASSRISLKISGSLLSIALFLAICWLALGFGQNDAGLGKFQGLMLWAPSLAGILLAIWFLSTGRSERISRHDASLAFILIFFPYAYAFGTNGNYWQAASSAGVFWVLAGVILARCAAHGKSGWAGLIPLAFVTQLVVALLLQNGMERPYRQNQALRLNNTAVEVDPTGPPLVMSKEYGAYIDEVKALADRAGFKPGMPMIDLTGQSPGILYVLRAQSLGYPWIAGGYPGSLAVARGGLSRFSCEQLVEAWLLNEPNGPRAIPVTLLESWGMSLEQDYELVAAWQTAAGAGDYKDRRQQQLYRPKPSKKEALQACERAGLERRKP